MRPLGVAALAIGWASASLHYAWQTATLLTLPSEQRISASERRVRALVPQGATVLAGEYWWSLGTDHGVLDSSFAEIRDLAAVDYIVLTGNGTGQPGQAQALHESLRGVAAREFVVIDDHLNRQPLEILGHRLTNSAWGFGALVMKNRRLSGELLPIAPGGGSTGSGIVNATVHRRGSRANCRAGALLSVAGLSTQANS